MRQLGDLFRRHPNTTIIWAHCGLGRIIHPVREQVKIVEYALSDPGLKHVNVDISWDEVAKYIVATPETVKAVAELINKYPDRFLLGTDEVVAYRSARNTSRVYYMYKPLFCRKLTPEAKEKLTKGNYKRIFDAARVKVRAWEKAHANDKEYRGNAYTIVWCGQLIRKLKRIDY